MNCFNMNEKLNSKILTDKSQKDFLYKGLNEYIDSIFNLDKVDYNDYKNSKLSKVVRISKKKKTLFIINYKSKR